MTFYHLLVPRTCSTQIVVVLATPPIKVPRSLLRDKLNNFGLSPFYIKCFQSYLSDRSSFVRVLLQFSSLLPVLSGVPQYSTLGFLPFNTFIKDLSAGINHSKFLLLANDLKMYRDKVSYRL